MVAGAEGAGGRVNDVAPTGDTEPPSTPGTAVLPAWEAGSLEALVCGYAWPCAEAVAIAGCESGFDAAGRLDGVWATNGNSYGLFQVNEVNRWEDQAHTRVKPGWETFLDDWMDAARNTWYAFQIWAGWGGWGAWACRWAAY